MAKENTVFMMGFIIEKPTVKINAEGEFVVARIKLLTIRRSWVNEELKLRGTPRVDVQHIITRNPIVIEKRIVPLEQGDMVFVKGSLCTRETKKKYTCPYCGVINVFEGAVMVYIDPIFIEKVNDRKYEEEEAREKLMSKAEISNCAFIFGTLCRPPEYYKSEKKEECDFQVATNRKRRIVEDGPDKTTDYPYVKTYGNKTQEYSEALHVGSEIFINGAIQSREITMVKTCASCGAVFQAKGVAMEIVPYSIEYLKNCNIPAPSVWHNEEDDNDEPLYSGQADNESEYADMPYEETDNNKAFQPYEEFLNNDDYSVPEVYGDQDDYRTSFKNNSYSADDLKNVYQDYYGEDDGE